QLIISANAGNDTLTSEVGPDLLPGEGVTFNGGDGTDVIQLLGSTSDDVITVGADELALESQGNLGSVQFAQSEKLLIQSGDGADQVDLAETSLFSANSITVEGGNGDDLLIGGGSGESLDGGAGNDTVIGN